MSQVFERIAAPFKLVVDLITDSTHAGDHLQDFGSSMTFGLIPPASPKGAETEKPLSEAEQKEIIAKANKKALQDVNTVLVRNGYGPIDIDDSGMPASPPPISPQLSSNPNPVGQLYASPPSPVNPLRLN